MKTLMQRMFLVIAILMGFSLLQAKAQMVGLPDSDELPQELSSYMGVKTTLNKELKEDVKKFCDKLKTKQINEEYRAQIVILMNAYRRKHANPSPHMHNLIKLLNAFWDKNQLEQFLVWSEYMQGVLTQNSVSMGRINELTVFTYHLVAHRSIETTSAKTWYFSTDDYRMYIDKARDGSECIMVECKNTDLRCKMKTDSTVVIYNTSGVYNNDTHEWNGNGGRVDWSRGNLPSDSIYAELGKYMVDVKNSDFEARDVTFFNRKYFSKGIKGYYRDKLVLNGTGDKARFPQFKSTDADIEIPNLAPGINYVGGYAQNGVLFLGEVEDSAKFAKLSFMYKEKPLVEAQSKSIVFGLNKLEAKQARILIHVGPKDTITHPGLKLKYNSLTEQLILYKHKDGRENASYIDTYHMLEIDVNQMEWTRNDTAIYLCTRLAAPSDSAIFRSMDFFSAAEYQQFQSLDRVNPLYALSDCAYKFWSTVLNARDFQRYLRDFHNVSYSLTQTSQLLLRLSYDGFVSYDAQTMDFVVEQKTHNYVQSYTKKKDYDAISIVSRRPGLKDYVNAVINLNNNDLSIFHVKPFDINTGRMVKMLPDSAVVVHDDRNMDFRGKLQAGLADIYGRNFKYHYEENNIEIPESDSMSMLAVYYDERRKRDRIDSVTSVFEGIKGVLQIDEFSNKGDRFEHNEYPILTTKDTSYVYYDRLSSDKYDRSKFYMQVYPFTLDSMNFLSLNGVKAQGKFVSSIFPDMEVTLTVQPDRSLGFVLPTPEEGMDLFKGKGSYHNTITLNSNGLSGDGEIRYLTAVARAKQFGFFPDSVMGGCYYLKIDPVTKAQIGTVKGVKAEYPDVSSDTCAIVWYPNSDRFVSSSQDTALFMYSKQMLFNGSVELTPDMMTADGESFYQNTGLFSKKYRLRNTSFDADSAMLCSFDPQNPGDSTGFIYTGRYDSKYDLDRGLASYVVSNDSALVYFPQHKYHQRTDFFEWDIQKDLYSFGKQLDGYPDNLIARSREDFEGLRNTNTERKPLLGGVYLECEKDTLQYDALSASFSPKDNVLNVFEPGVIKVVDAKIDPSGIMLVTPGGFIQKFDNAVITANIDSTIHKVVNTTVKIRDKYYYKATGGQYEYHSELQGVSFLNMDSLEIRRIKLDTAQAAPKERVSFGIGTVHKEQQFMLSPQYMFMGKFSMQGNVPGIKFNGYAYIRQECDTNIAPFKFEGNLDPDSIVFPVSARVVDLNHNRLHTGFFYSEDSLRVYSLFMGRKYSERDSTIIQVGKGLTFDKNSGEFRMASPKRLADTAVTEDYMVLYRSICNLYAEGNINTNVNLKPLNLQVKGEIYHNKDLDRVSMNTLLSLNFPIRNDVMKIMAEDMNDAVGLKPVTLNKTKIRKRLQFLMGNDTVAKFLDGYELTGEVNKIPNGLKAPIVLADLKMYFDTTTHSYRSQGRIGVGFIDGIAVNKYMKGNVEILHSKKKGDQISIYLQPNDRTWYYFNYNAGFMYCLSSNNDFNDKVINTKEKDRVTKFDKMEYQYVVAAAENKTKFVRSFKSEQEPQDEETNAQDINRELQENQPVDSTAVDIPGIPQLPATDDDKQESAPAEQSQQADEDDFELEESAPEPAADNTEPVVEEAPAPAVEEAPAPAVEETPAPAVEEAPAPAPEAEEEPDFIDE